MSSDDRVAIRIPSHLLDRFITKKEELGGNKSRVVIRALEQFLLTDEEDQVNERITHIEKEVSELRALIEASNSDMKDIRPLLNKLLTKVLLND